MCVVSFSPGVTVFSAAACVELFSFRREALKAEMHSRSFVHAHPPRVCLSPAALEQPHQLSWEVSDASVLPPEPAPPPPVLECQRPQGLTLARLQRLLGEAPRKCIDCPVRW